MSLLPLLIGYMLMQAGGPNASAPAAARGKRGKKTPGWPSPGSPPPSGGGLAIPPMPPMPPMPAEHPATPLADLHAASKDTPQTQAAQQLYDYISHGDPNWGFPGRPSAPIKTGQTGMRGLVNDGIYGPKTQARCAQLLAHPCPARPGAKGAATSAAKNAAKNKATSMIKTGVPKLRIP
jgi:hypothetical protein